MTISLDTFFIWKAALELRHLRYFLAVAQELSFSRAAVRLGISQPPLSQQIQALEAELQVQLLDRSSRRVRLTAAGLALQAEAQEIIAHAERAKTAARRAATGTIGQLRVGFTPSVPFIEPFSRSLRAYGIDFPDVEVRVVEAVSRQQVTAISEDKLDVGFIRTPLPPIPKGVETAVVHKDGLVVIARRDHRFAAMKSVTVPDLRGEPMIVMDPSAGTGLHGQVKNLMALHGFGPTVAQEARGAWTPISLVAAGLGVSVVYSSLVSRLKIGDVIQRPLSDAAESCEVLLAYKRDSSVLVREYVSRVLSLRRI